MAQLYGLHRYRVLEEDPSSSQGHESLLRALAGIWGAHAAECIPRVLPPGSLFCFLALC